MASRYAADERDSTRKCPSGYQAPLCVKKEHGPATVFCCDCDKFFCEKCINKHQECDWLSDHKQTPVEEMSFYDIKYAQASRKTCPEHDLPLTILCKTCKKVICHTCLLYKHKDDQHQELLQSASEAKKGMDSMTIEAKKVINKQNKALKDTLETKTTIRKDVKEAKESVKKAAQHLCERVRKHEKNLLDDLDRYEEEAIQNLESVEGHLKTRKADAISLQEEICSLLQFGKPIEQVERTPVLQEKFDAQQKLEEGSMTWKYVCERKDLSEESVKSMLGDVKLVTPRITLGQPLQQVPLKYTGCTAVTGMVVVGDCLCVVHWGDPRLWLYNLNSSQNKTLVVPYLEDPKGMALVNPTDCTVAITDENAKGGHLHYVKVSEDLEMTYLSSKNITLKMPRRVSVSLDNSELLIGQWGKPQFLVCDLQGNIKRQVTIKRRPNEFDRFPFCVQQTTSGYAAIMLDHDESPTIQWLGEDGTCRHSYGRKDDERFKSCEQMVRDSAGQLIVVDQWNRRLHLVSSSGRHAQLLLTKDDGIVYPDSIYLDEAAERLYVAHGGLTYEPHGKVGSVKVCVYKWPQKSGELNLSLTILKV